MLRVTVCLLSFVGVVVLGNDGLFELNIIHYNDFHAHFDEVSPTGAACNPTTENCVGGFARLYTAVSQAMEAEPDSLLFNGGDSFQGSIWYIMARWNATYRFMNMMPHDAHVLGNHEFRHSIDGMVPYLERLSAPMLGANVNATLEPTLDPLIKKHVILTRNGRRIGVIGVLLRVFSAPAGALSNVVMEDELEAVNREAALLTEQGVDIIIVLSHVGYESDLAMALGVVPEVDIIVGAHSHTLLFNGQTPSGEHPSGEYPTVVTQTNGHRIPIVQASCYTKYLGNIKFYINDAGIVESWSGEPIYLGTSIVPDPGIMNAMAEWGEEIGAVGSEVIGATLVTLQYSDCYEGECSLGSWACDGFLDETIARASVGAWIGAHACMIDAGRFRVLINPGEVTTAGLVMATPYAYMVQAYDLKGEFLLEALEHSVGTVQSSNEFYSSQMSQLGGLRVVFNTSAPIGFRVASALIRCIECDVPRYLPVEPQATYRIVSQDFLAEGGAGYTMVSNNRENVENLGVDYEVLRRYMKKQAVILQDLDGRIQIVY